MTDYHEPWDAQSEEDRNIHRALMSLKEEIEAADWYHERAAATRDESLRKILVHNRDEEIEHSCMLLEWLRRRMPAFQEQLSLYLFKEEDITEIEEMAESGDEDGQEVEAAPGSTGLGIGKPKGDE
ncbi:MAG: ferritin-like domain-containing protein [Candidatus Krumholzibacteriia bacterium]